MAGEVDMNNCGRKRTEREIFGDELRGKGKYGQGHWSVLWPLDLLMLDMGRLRCRCTERGSRSGWWVHGVSERAETIWKT